MKQGNTFRDGSTPVSILERVVVAVTELYDVHRTAEEEESPDGSILDESLLGECMNLLSHPTVVHRLLGLQEQEQRCLQQPWDSIESGLFEAQLLDAVTLFLPMEVRATLGSTTSVAEGACLDGACLSRDVDHILVPVFRPEGHVGTEREWFQCPVGACVQEGSPVERMGFLEDSHLELSVCENSEGQNADSIKNEGGQ